MADELIDAIDEDNNLTGDRIMKSRAHKEGIWHRAVHIWIYNSKCEILLQLRAKNKELHPGKWDISAAGHVSSGEEVIVSAIREVEEEIGLNVGEDDLEFYRIRKNSSSHDCILNNEFHYIYFLKLDIGIDKLKLGKEEVESAKFLGLDMLEKELDSTPEKYVPHGNYWEEVIFEVKKRI